MHNRAFPLLVTASSSLYQRTPTALHSTRTYSHRSLLPLVRPAVSLPVEDATTTITQTPIDMDVKPRERGGIAGVCRVALVAVVVLLIVISYYPFAWDPPGTVSNQVTRNADGTLQFGEMNNARTPGTPAWLEDVRTSGDVQILLEFAPESLQEHASMMMLANNFFNTDFAIVQDHSDLLVYLRRPGSDTNGDPPFAVDGLLRSQRWNSVDVVLRHDDIQIAVDGQTTVTDHIPADSARVWGQGQIALGDEVNGGGPWQGKMRLAQVLTGGHVVNYVRPGALSIPKTYFYFPDHVLPFPPKGEQQWLDVFLDMVSFIPLGFLIVWAQRPPGRAVPATVLAALLAVALAAGKILFHGRHISLAAITMEIFGALLGALLASRLAHSPGAYGRSRAFGITRTRNWSALEGADND